MNITEAVCLMLRENAEISVDLDARVYGAEITPAEVRAQPRPAVVVTASGLGANVGNSSDVKSISGRFDVRCYGESPYEADQVHNAVHDAMKSMRRKRFGATVLQTAEVSGGPLAGRDGYAHWPYTVGSYIVSATID